MTTLFSRTTTAAAAAILGSALSVAALAASAAAQQYPGYGNGPGMHMGMRQGVNVLHGTVSSFSPYRLLLAEGPQRTTQVDLNKGTKILPVGTSLTPGMRVTVHGHWSKGTFIANRVVLR